MTLLRPSRKTFIAILKNCASDSSERTPLWRTRMTAIFLLSLAVLLHGRVGYGAVVNETSDTSGRHATEDGILLVGALRNDSSGIRANIRVEAGGSEVLNDYTDSTTGVLSAALAEGMYDVIVDPPSPYATRRFDGVTIVGGDTTRLTAILRFVVEPSPTSIEQAMGSGETGSRTLVLSNTTGDSVAYRAFIDFSVLQPHRDTEHQSPAANTVEMKGYGDDVVGPAQTAGRGGPDAFGYRWLDSDEPDGPSFGWIDIRSEGTQITGMGDDTNLGPFPIGFDFPFYGNSFNQVRVCSNGFLSFISTSTAYVNTAIPSTAEPNNAIYVYWDDLDVFAQGTVHYYHDVQNERFIVQYTDVPHYGWGGRDTLTFEVILTRNGEILVQYLRMLTGIPNSATIGIENDSGSVALQVVNYGSYVRDSLALRFWRPSWMSIDAPSGILLPHGSLNLTVTFNTNGVDVGTYEGHILIEVSHPDMTTPVVVPVRLTVRSVDHGYITVVSPNGGEVWLRGQSYLISWTRLLVDSVKIELSRTGSGGPWQVIASSAPARPIRRSTPRGLETRENVNESGYS